MDLKRSRAVRAFLVISTASALNNCGQKHEAARRCVDENGGFADDRNCATSGAVAGHHYAWVYAPVGASNKTGDESTPAASGSEATSRGVIGAEGAAHAGGGEGGAGGGGEGGGE